MTHFSVVARNFSEAHENKIHSDDIAQKYGFRGALVPGVAVYGHLTLPLVNRFGEAWLGSSVNELRLLKPAYHEDRLTLSLTESASTSTVECHNADGDLLAVVNSRAEVPAVPEAVAKLDAPAREEERLEIAWDTIVPDQPFAPWRVTLDREMNQKYVTQVADEQPLFETLIHPHLIQSLANTALTREYVMPAWIHVGTETRHRQVLKVGDEIDIRSVPLEKWRNKGHEFIRLLVTFFRDGELTTDMLHTAIYRVAD